MRGLRDPESYMPDAAAVAEIKAQIEAYNRARPAIYDACMKWAVIACAAYAVAALVLYNMISDMKQSGFILIVLGAGGYFLWTLMWRPMDRHQAALRARLFPSLFGFMDNVGYAKGVAPPFLHYVKTLGLVEYEDASNDDLITGRHEGMDFELLETELTVGHKNRKTVFKGLIFHFRLDRPFPGILVAAKRGNWLDRALGGLFSSGPGREIKSGNSRLDETHQFFTDNFGAARPVIDGPLISVLTWFGNEWHGGDVRIAITDEHGYLLLPSPHNYFELPGRERDMDYDRDARPLIHEMVTALSVAHAVRAVG